MATFTDMSTIVDLGGQNVYCNNLVTGITKPDQVGPFNASTIGGSVLSSAGPVNFSIANGTVWQRPASSSLNAIPFGSIVNEGTFTGTGVGGANYFDSVISTGWNIGQTIETPAIPGIAVNFDSWESKFHLPGAGDYQIERHFGLIDTNSVVHRYMSFSLPWDGVGATGGASSSSAIGTIQLDQLNFNNWAGTQTLVMNLTGNVLNINNGFLFFVSNNNVSTFRQSNAAANAFLPLPYINASNQLQISQPLVATGSITAGTDIISNNTNFLIRTIATLANAAAAQTATLTNAPTAGNPTKWISFDDNGTTRRIPAW